MTDGTPEIPRPNKFEFSEKVERNSNVLGNSATVGGVALALVFSVISTLQSCRALDEAKNANRIANEANRLSQESDLRERGVRAPYIQVDALEDKIVLDSETSLDQAAMGLLLRNLDSDPINMVRLQSYVIFVHDFTSLKKLDRTALKTAWHQEIEWNFPETVRSGGLGKVDMKASLLKQLLKIDISLMENHDLEILMNVTCAARYVGQSDPTSLGIDEKPDRSRQPEELHYTKLKDSDILSIHWNPSKLKPEIIKTYLTEYQPERWVSNQ